MNRRPLTASLTIVCWLTALAAFGADKTVTVQIRVDSEAVGFEGYRAMDGDPKTMWHTDYEFQQTAHPHEIVVDLGAPYELSGFAYLPRQGGGNGTIGRYECYVSDNGKDFGKPVEGGNFGRRNGEHVVQFVEKLKCRYVKLRALSEVSGQP